MELANGQRIPNENRPSKGPPTAPTTVTPACLRGRISNFVHLKYMHAWVKLRFVSSSSTRGTGNPLAENISTYSTFLLIVKKSCKEVSLCVCVHGSCLFIHSSCINKSTLPASSLPWLRTVQPWRCIKVHIRDLQPNCVVFNFFF